MTFISTTLLWSILSMTLLYKTPAPTTWATTIPPQLFPKASSISTPKTTSSSSPSTKTLHSSSEEPSTQILTHSPMAPGSLPLKSTPLELAISVHASTMTTLYYT